MDDKTKKPGYGAGSIQVLTSLGAIRRKYDLVELSNKLKKRGDATRLSKDLQLNYSSLKRAVYEARILGFFPHIHKSKAHPLSWLKTNRELLKFAKLHNIHNLSVSKLNKAVKRWNETLKENPFILVSQEEHDLIMGSLLGDASIRQRDRNCCFRVSHSLKQTRYIGWKLSILKFLNISEFSERKRIINNREIVMINLSTKTHPVFNYYRHLFYKSGRKEITPQILSQLNPRSLAVWVCDDGSYSTKQSYIILCTNSYSLDEHKLMKQFFNKRFSLDPTIGFRDKKYYYLRFKQEDSKKLIKIIEPFIPMSMKYKLGK